MRISRREAEDALALPQVQAFLRVIRQGESSQDDRAYFMRWPGLGKPVAYFTSLGAHPRIFEPTYGGKSSSAAGAYQITWTTWNEFAPLLGLTDFSRRSQDICAVALIARRDALADVLAGRLEDAIFKCRQEWTSLPGAAENNARWTMTAARELYLRYLQQFEREAGQAPAPDTQPAAPIEDRPAVPQEKPMPLPIAALIATFGPLIAQMIPQVAKLFAKPESATAQRNVQAIELVFNAVKEATAQPSLGAAIEAMQADPAALAAATKAVVTTPAIMEVLEIGGGIEKAREQNVAAIAADKPLWKNPALVITVMLLPLVYWVTGSVLLGSDDPNTMWRGFWGTGFMPETRSATVNLILGMVLGGIMGFFFGTTFGSGRKTELLAPHPEAKQ